MGVFSSKSRRDIERSSWKIKPAGYIDTEDLIEQDWDDILRLIATIKLKETTASEIFRQEFGRTLAEFGIGGR